MYLVVGTYALCVCPYDSQRSSGISSAGDFPNGSSLKLECINSVKFVGQGTPGICISLPLCPSYVA